MTVNSHNLLFTSFSEREGRILKYKEHVMKVLDLQRNFDQWTSGTNIRNGLKYVCSGDIVFTIWRCVCSRKCQEWGAFGPNKMGCELTFGDAEKGSCGEFIILFSLRVCMFSVFSDN